MIFIFLLNKVQTFVLRMKNVQDVRQSEARKKELQMRLRVFFDNKISQGTPSNSLVMVNLNVIRELNPSRYCLHENLQLLIYMEIPFL